MNETSHIISLAILGINLFVGVFVLFKNLKSRIHLAFFIFVLGIVLWGAGINLLYLTHSFLFDKVALGGGLLMFFGMYLFAYLYPNRTKPSFGFWLGCVPLVLSAIILPFDLFIQGIRIDEYGFVEPINGPLFPVYLSLAAGYSIASIVLLIQTYRKSLGAVQLQVEYIGFGIGCFLLTMFVCNALLPMLGIYQLNFVGPVASLILITCIAMGIVRHQLMDIRIVAQNGVIYAALLSGLLATYAILLQASAYLINSDTLAAPVAAGIATILAGCSFPFIHAYLREATHHIFFPGTYSYPIALEEISKALSRGTDTAMLIAACTETLDRILQPSYITFVFHYDRTDEVTIPIYIEEECIGQFILGEKKSGRPYTEEDQRLMRTFALQASTAFHKAQMYSELLAQNNELEERVRIRTIHLEELQRNQKQFMDDIAHALQTPLTILKSALEGKTNKHILRSVDDLSRLIRTLLHLAKIESVREKQYQSIQLSALVSDLVEYVSVSCAPHKISLSCSVQENVEIMGDAKQLEEAITNILANAVRYTAFAEKRNVSVTLRASNDTALLTISDTGPGIDPERLEHIFKRFYRTQEHEGTGLGLAITKRIIEQHGGHISAANNGGAVISITLPVRPLDGEPE